MGRGGKGQESKEGYWGEIKADCVIGLSWCSYSVYFTHLFNILKLF